MKWLATLIIAQSVVLGGVNSRINDTNPERIYVLPINVEINRPSKWNILRPPALFRLHSGLDAPPRMDVIGITLVGTRGSNILKIGLYLDIQLKSHCYRERIVDTNDGSTLKVTVYQEWYPLLFCNNRDEKIVKNLFLAESVKLPGYYRIEVNGKSIGDVEYTVDSNKVRVSFNGREYSLDDINYQLIPGYEPSEKDRTSE